MRAVPAVKFVRDGSLAEGIRIANLVSDTLNKDEARAKLAGRSLDDETTDDQESNTNEQK
jgi:ribosome-binding factor A